MRNNKIGLALSGGGYRATAFHVGTLRALHKMGILQNVDVISTISGGSITGAVYCLREGDFESFDAAMLDAVCTKSVVCYVLTSWIFVRFVLFLAIFIGSAIWLQFHACSWISMILMGVLLILILFFQFLIFPVSDVIEKGYDEFFFKGATLSMLPAKPLLSIGSTNLQTGRPFTFSGKKMEDSHYAYEINPAILFKHADFPISRAVMASTCVPYAFSPVQIESHYFQDQEDMKRCRPTLVDGGIYDNQGIHKITHPGSSFECSYIIASDAGNKLPFEKKYSNAYLLILRTFEVFMGRIKNFQMAQHLFQDAESKTKEVAYLSLGWELSSCISRFIVNVEKKNVMQQIIEAHAIPVEWIRNVKEYRAEIQNLLETNVGYSSIKEKDLTLEQWGRAKNVKTSLCKLKRDVVELLSRHAENMTELQVKLYCPGICPTGIKQ